MIYLFFKGEWEWDWTCTIPQGIVINEENRDCVYEGGEAIAMPGREEGIFETENGKSFEIGVPLLFVVRVRIREKEEGEVIAEGRWEQLFTPVSEDLGFEIVENSWICEDASIGYLVSFFFFFFFFFNN